MESIEMKIEDLKERAASRETMRYPEAFKQDATEVVGRLREDGFTQTDISDLLEIPWVTLARWKDSSDDAEESGVASGFRPVKVVDDPSGEVEGEPVLVAPSGWRIEGLSVTEVVEVARRLS